MNRAAQLWTLLRGSLWFLPTVIVLASIAAALVLIETGSAGIELAGRWPRVFGASAEGSREMLSSIATSMITTAGVVLSVTIVALAQASSQYSPRVLRNFVRDVPTQLVLGSFVGSFAYCLVVLRTVRGGDDGFVPSLAVFGGIIYAFAAIALLIFFIHHVAQSIQAAFIVSRIFEDTLPAIEHAFPAQPARQPQPAGGDPLAWTWVESPCDGYVIAVDTAKLVRCAHACGRAVRLAPRIGDFVAATSPVLALAGREPVAAETAGRLLEALRFGRQRTTEQDPAFGLQQLVDVAVKALSPGINDPSTACLCIDRLGALMARAAGRAEPEDELLEAGRLLLVMPRRRFASLLALAFDAILQHSRGNVQVLGSVLEALELVHTRCADATRHRALARVARAAARAASQLRTPESGLVRRRARQLALACCGDAVAASRRTRAPT